MVKPSCIVCNQLLLVTCDIEKVTLIQLVEDGFKRQNKIIPFSVATDSGNILYEAEEDDEVSKQSSQMCMSTLAQLEIEEQPISILDEDGVYYRAWISHQGNSLLHVERISCNNISS